MLVGRDTELAELKRHLNQASAGSGLLLLLGGDAGAGKSALLEFLLGQESTAVRAVGRCPGPGETPAYGPWLEAFARLRDRLPDPAEPLPPPFGQAVGEWQSYGMAGALADWLAGGRPVLVALEDIHWADAASLELLRHMPGQLAGKPVLILATYRTDELHRTHPLWTLLPQLQRAGAHRITVGPLPAKAVEELAAAMLPDWPDIAGLAERIHQRTEGHALFTRELLLSAARAGAPNALNEARLPETVQQSIDAHLARLSQPTVDVLQAAAVIGERFSYDLLARVAEAPEDQILLALEEADAFHMILPQNAAADQFAFAHALFREALLGRLIGPRRRRWHLKVAEALQASPSPDLESLALHLERAGDRRAIDCLMELARRTHRMGARLQCAEQVERALNLMDPEDPRRAEAYLILAFCWEYADFARRRNYLREAVQAGEAVGDRAVASWAREELLSLRSDASDEEMMAVEEEQEALLDDPRWRELFTALYHTWTGYPIMSVIRIQALAYHGRIAEAEALLAKTYRRAAPGARLVAIKQGEAIVASRLGDTPRAIRLLEEAAAERIRYNYATLAAWTIVNLLSIRLLAQDDNPDEVDATAARALDLADQAYRRTGHPFVPEGFSPTGIYQFWRGDWVNARKNLVELIKQDPGLTGWYSTAATLLGAVGTAREGLDLLKMTEPLQPGGPPIPAWSPLERPLTYARLHLQLGELERARAWVETCEDWLRQVPSRWEEPTAILLRAELHRRDGRAAAALEAAARGLALAEEVRNIPARLTGHRLIGELQAAAGRPAEAGQHLQAAIALAERCRFPYEAALGQLALARALPQAAGTAQALAGAHATFARLGAAPALAEAESLLNATEAAPASAPPATALPDGLTEREAEVVRLVAQGLSDKEVAARLFISPRTVDGHLRHIFNKVNVANRAALTAYAARTGLLS